MAVGVSFCAGIGSERETILITIYQLILLRMKKNFFKFLLLGALTFAVGAGFVGCKDYDGEIEDLQGEIDAMKLSISEIQAKLSGKIVKDVTGSGNVLTVTYVDGSTPSTITVTNGTGANPGNLSIGNNGNWFSGTTDTGIPVYGKPKIEDGVWSFPAVSNGAVTYVKSNIPASGSYIVRNPDGTISLWIAARGETELQEINLPTASTGVTEIEFLGWMWNKGANNQALSADLAGTAANGVASETDMQINYAWISDFYLEPATPGQAPGTNGRIAATKAPASYVWEGQLTVNKGQVLNTMAAQGMGFLIQITPSTADISQAVASLQNSNTEMPIKLGAPVRQTGLLTKAAAASGLWFVPALYTDGQVYSVSSAVAGAVGMVGPSALSTSNGNFSRKFTTTDDMANNALYYIVLDGKKSENSLFSINPLANVTSEEEPVAGIRANNVTYTLSTPGAGTVFPATDPLDIYPAQTIEVGTWYSLTFAPTLLAPAQMNNTAAIADLVLDYTIDAPAEYPKVQFGLEIDNTNGTFRVTKLPDVITEAGFALNVRKLGVDGFVYFETIAVKPLRKATVTTIALGDYTIIDKFPADLIDYLSAPIRVNLDQMFTDLAAVADGSTTLKVRWQDDVRGADGYGAAPFVGIASVAGGATDQWARFSTPETGGVTADVTATAWNEAGVTSILGYKKDGTLVASSVTPPVATGVNEWNKVEYLMIYPNYAYGAALPSFVPNQLHTFRFSFVDDNGLALNTLNVTFTPRIPSLAELFKKDTPYWNDDQTVLNAYYKDPFNPWNGTKFFSAVNGVPTGVLVNLAGAIAPSGAENNNSTYYNVLNSGNHTSARPNDGGYLRFGGAYGVDTIWVANPALSVADPTNQKIGGQLVANNLVYIRTAAGATGLPTVVQLLGQTAPTGINGTVTIPASPYGKAGADAYNTPIRMQPAFDTYLGFYTIAATSAEMTALAFDMKIMSALERGVVRTKDNAALVIPAASASDVLKITSAHIEGFNYNKVVYGLFQEPLPATAGGVIGYDYNYVSSVTFSIPAGPKVYDILEDDGNGVLKQSDNVDVPAMPAVAASAGPPVVEAAEGYLPIKPSGISQTTETSIIVKVTDRFGRVLTGEIPFTIKMN